MNKKIPKSSPLATNVSDFAFTEPGQRNFYFERSNGEYILLASNVTEQDAMKCMRDFLKQYNYISYYTRSWHLPNGTKAYDVGSHSEFFYWGEIENNEKEKN